MVRGFTVWGCANALRKNRFAAAASRLAESRKSIVWPWLSTARYRYIQRPLTLTYVSSTRQEPLVMRGSGRMRFSSSSVGLDPTEDGGVVHLHATIQQHELEITVADRKHQIPPDRPQDHLGGELPAFEGLIPRYLGRSSTLGHPTASTRPRRRRK